MRSHVLLAACVGLVIFVGLRPDLLVQGESQLSFAMLADLNGFKTFSGLFTLLGVAALLSKRFTPAAVLFIIAGSAGTGIFWDRWSRAAGEHFQLSALFSGVRPESGDLQLLAMHLPLLIIGLLILAMAARETERVGGASDGS